jgi:hypothetical protein
MRGHCWQRGRIGLLAAVLGCSSLAALAAPARGQGTIRPTGSDSSVGYIDPALIGNVLRERFDAAYNFTRPTRAEFFYAQTRPGGPGLPLPEPRIDYQELSTYLECRAAEDLSAFVEVPERFLNPEVNANAWGLGDMNLGVKCALLCDQDRVATFQFRTYIPTGNATLGLGNNHVSLEPALLGYQRLGDRAALESELRLWSPVGGTGFAGNIVRYGVGIHYDLARACGLQLTPVAEFVGWTVLNGKESVVQASGVPEVFQAAGDTIINAKLGVRVRFRDVGDIYAGYGRPLTGDRWYENIWRLEFRLFF